MAETTTADLLVNLLVDKWGVRHIFGMPGDGINGVMESLRKRQKDVQFIGVRHEETAAFAACAYAKFSGKLGVCLSTSGPGAIHMLNGLYDAKLDGAPVLAITGMQYSDLLGTFYQQDVDTVRLMDNVSVYSERVMGPGHVENVANLAVRMALGKRGVAHIGIPNDIQELPATEAKYSPMDTPNHTSADWRVPIVIPTEIDLAHAASVLNAGKRVAIVVGAGAKGARAEVEAIAEALGAPVAKAYLGKDVLPDDSPYTTGGLGVWGTSATAATLKACDTLLLVGSSFPFISYLPKPEGVRGVQIDLDPTRIGLRFPAEVGLVGDAHATLQALLPHLERKTDRTFLTQAQENMKKWRDVLQTREQSQDMPLRPQAFAAAVSHALADDALICGDSGQNTFYLSRHIGIRGEQKTAGTGTLATMASGLPYAIGASAAFPGRQVITFTGDGGLAMLMAEISTCVKYNLPVKIFVLKNNALGLIRWEQMMYLGHPEYGVELGDIDFAKVAEACGAEGFTVTRPDEIDTAIAAALSAPGPALVQAIVDPFEPVVPGQIKPEQAQHYAKALTEEQPNKERIARAFARDIEEDPTNRETLSAAFQETVPGLLEAAAIGEQSNADGEPDAALRANREGASERHSGKE